MVVSRRGFSSGIWSVILGVVPSRHKQNHLDRMTMTNANQLLVPSSIPRGFSFEPVQSHAVCECGLWVCCCCCCCCSYSRCHHCSCCWLPLCSQPAHDSPQQRHRPRSWRWQLASFHAYLQRLNPRPGLRARPKANRTPTVQEPPGANQRHQARKKIPKKQHSVARNEIKTCAIPTARSLRRRRNIAHLNPLWSDSRHPRRARVIRRLLHHQLLLLQRQTWQCINIYV